MADNLWIRSTSWAAVHHVGPYVTEVFAEPMAQVPLCEISHEVHFISKTIPKSRSNFADPDQEVGLVVWFRAASGVGRPPGSKAFVFGDEVYFFMTWTDILGSGHGRECDAYRQREGRGVHFLQVADRVGRDRVMLGVRSFMRSEG